MRDDTKDAARYRKLRQYLRVETEAASGDAEVVRTVRNDMILQYYGPEINGRTVDEILDLVPDLDPGS